MKYLNIALTSALLLALPLSASADDCSWSYSAVASGGSTANVTYYCSIDGSVAATKTSVTRAVGSPGCSISLTNDFYNSGTCDSPNITTIDPCTNSGAVYGIFWAGEWSSNIDAIQNFCGACGYNTVPIWQPQGGEPQLKVTCN